MWWNVIHIQVNIRFSEILGIIIIIIIKYWPYWKIFKSIYMTNRKRGCVITGFSSERETLIYRNGDRRGDSSFLRLKWNKNAQNPVAVRHCLHSSDSWPAKPLWGIWRACKGRWDRCEQLVCEAGQMWRRNSPGLSVTSLLFDSRRVEKSLMTLRTTCLSLRTFYCTSLPPIPRILKSRVALDIFFKQVPL